MENNNIKVLIGCIYYNYLTGSEMYVYELAKSLKKLGCEVTICAMYVGYPLNQLTEREGIKVYQISEIPRDITFDIIHAQHHPVVNTLIKLYPNTPKICSIHSELISLEYPVIDSSIKRYIAIRPSIKDMIENQFNINCDIIDIIYNPIDDTRFNTSDTSDGNYILFVGTFDHLRQNPTLDLCNYAKEINKEFWVVGRGNMEYIEKIKKYDHVKCFNETYDIQNFVKNCSETGGILLGRTTIEGWLCGKPGWIYDVDSYGNIISKTFNSVPDDIEKYQAKNVANQIKNIYKSILI